MFKKILLAAALCLSLSSCDSDSNVGEDGYTFEVKEYDKSEVRVRFVKFNSQKEYDAKMLELKLDPKIVRAFSTLHPPSFDTCTIYMVDAPVRYDPTMIGHELHHCIYGQWHPKMQKTIDNS